MKRKSKADIISDYTGYELHVHFDGSCNPNPGGLGTYGYTISKMDNEGIKGNGSLGRRPDMTNNIAEWSGLAAALHRIRWDCELTGDKILIFGDSQLVLRQLTGRWKIKAPHLRAYQQTCLEHLEQIGLPWEALWVPRNENRECDSLAEAVVDFNYASTSAII